MKVGVVDCYMHTIYIYTYIYVYIYIYIYTHMYEFIAIKYMFAVKERRLALFWNV